MEKKKTGPKGPRGEYKVKTPTRGGARPGAGRPKGSGNKVSLGQLLDELELAAGKPYEKQLATNYANAIFREDWGKVSEYDRAFLNKIVADKQEVELTDSTEMVEAKRQAFAEAIAQLVSRDD